MSKLRISQLTPLRPASLAQLSAQGTLQLWMLAQEGPRWWSWWSGYISILTDRHDLLLPQCGFPELLFGMESAVFSKMTFSTSCERVMGNHQ